MSENNEKRVSRRKIGKIIGGTTILGTGVVYLSADQTTAESHAEFTASDPDTVYDNDGDIEAVYVEPDIEISWENFSDGIEDISVEIKAEADGTEDVIYDFDLDSGSSTPDGVEDANSPDSGFDEQDNYVDLDLVEADITEEGGSIDEDNYSDSSITSGENSETETELIITADISGSDGDEDEAVVSETFTVTVKNPETDSAVGGEANTDAE